MQQQTSVLIVILITILLFITISKRVDPNYSLNFQIPQVFDTSNLVKFTYTDPLTKRVGRDFIFNDTSNDFRYLAHARLRHQIATSSSNPSNYPQPVTAISKNHVKELCMNLQSILIYIVKSSGGGG